MKRVSFLAALLALAMAPLGAAETPSEIADALSQDQPHVKAMLRAHPEILKVWREDFWADALLRSPVIPGTPWRSHDFRRPQPPLAHPAMLQCAGAAPPEGAAILLSHDHPLGFAGEDLSLWRLEGGVLTSSGRINNRIATVGAFGDVRIHIEFRTPAIRPLGAWQYRGNSGVFLMGLYEVQILDSWNNPTYPDGSLGALYGQNPPSANASLPPGHWQCLDIDFTAPRFDGEVLHSPARVSVRVNDVLVQDNSEFLGPTAFGELRPYAPHAPRLAFTLQDHGDATSQVSFRNIWAQPIGPNP